MKNLEIVTSHITPPIPNRIFDWQAVRGDWDLDDPIGNGRTELEAIKELLELEDEVFNNWWVSVGQAISEKKYAEEVEKEFLCQKFVDNKVKEYYGVNCVGCKDHEGNAFWYVLEEKAKKNKLHLI